MEIKQFKVAIRKQFFTFVLLIMVVFQGSEDVLV